MEMDVDIDMNREHLALSSKCVIALSLAQVVT